MTPSELERPSRRVLLLLLFIAVLVVYSNHFGNSFHFDDFHAVVDNPAIRSLGNLPRFFTDSTLFSVLPANRTWRPLVSASLAVDYWLANGLNPAAFHASTFLLHLALMAVLFLLAERLFEQANPGGANRLPALLAAALFGLHPLCAETVNYIVQRGDLYATLGVAAGLYLYGARPEWRGWGLYLLPAAAGQISKPPALIFPALLILYIRASENRRWRDALRDAIPATAAAAAIGALTAAMTPATFSGGAASRWNYWITQPYVIWRQFTNVLAPAGLSADTDLTAFTRIGDPRAVWGILFVAALGAAGVRLLGRSRTAPVGFGILWFLLANVPTALYAVAEVENDHRAFFPFAGLAIALGWAVALLWTRAQSLFPRPALAAACAGLTLAAGLGWATHARNEVWRNEASLWRDVTEKSPHNGRGLMNYGLTLLAAGDSEGALKYFEQARLYTPNYYILEINLGVAAGSLGRDVEAEAHFHRAQSLAPGDSLPNYYYARWLGSKGRIEEALNRANQAMRANPADQRPAALAAELRSAEAARAAELARLERDAAGRPTAENLLSLSLLYHRMRRFDDSIRAARGALQIKPDYAEAYNNLAAAHEELRQWDAAIAAAREAVRLKPDFTLARNNLAWAETQRNREHPAANHLELTADRRR